MNWKAYKHHFGKKHHAKCIMFNIYLRRSEILLIFFRHFVERPAKIIT